MKKEFEYATSIGLPGGPNEMFTYVTGVFSSEGYKRNSPDVNNPFNIIPSGNITMRGVDFPVKGTDNLGNTKVMQPGKDYKFPGDMVFETPMAKYGGGLLTKTMKCKNCGWSWKAADGGSDVTTCHKCGGQAAPKAQDGKELTAEGGRLPEVVVNRFAMSQDEKDYRVKERAALSKYQRDVKEAEDLGQLYPDRAQTLKQLAQENYVKNRGSVYVNPRTSAPQPEIKTYEEPSSLRKFINRMANPVTTLGYAATGEMQPDLISRDNAFDYVADLYNPFSIAEAAYDAAASYREGDYLGMGLNALGAIPALPFSGKQAKAALKNAYKLNPYALKEAQEQMLVRARPVGQDPYINMAEGLKAREARGEQLKWYQKNLTNPQTNPDIIAREKYYGQWFADNPSNLDFYINPGTRNFADDAQIEILKARMPKSEAAKYSVKNFEDAKKLSNLHDTEYILPKDMVQNLERYSVDDLNRLQKEYKEMNTPHWLRGYGSNTPKQLPGSSAASSVDDVGKGSWQMKELPGLHLKSTMEGQAISKIVDKTGKINTEQALAIIGKESGGADKVALIKQGLGDNIPKKMDFNEFRKVTQDQAIILEKQIVPGGEYGVSNLGYDLSSPKIKTQKILLSNKSKFGRGSSAHGNPDETLGHIHELYDADLPDVLTVTQIQSDAFQGTHRIMPKNAPDASKAEKSLQRMQEIQERNKSVLNKMKTEGLDEAGLPVQQYQIKQFEDIVKGQETQNIMKKGEVENFTQKQLLDKNHQERYLQELVDYAGKRGDVNKVRVPTSETAAKVQGYTKTYSNDLLEEIKKLREERLITASKEGIYSDKFKELDNQIKTFELNNIKNYIPEDQTILKKYSEQPKTIKKLFGKEPKIVTDSKGNTWYEFDIPDKAKKGKMEIKAFTTTGAAIGTGAASNEFQSGGETEMFSMYSDYINGIFDGTEMEEKASKVYDKLNRMHHKKAKTYGTTVPNYIMSVVIKQMNKD